MLGVAAQMFPDALEKSALFKAAPEMFVSHLIGTRHPQSYAKPQLTRMVHHPRGQTERDQL